MTAPDTSAEAVERLAPLLHEGRLISAKHQRQTAVMLRALLKERDALAGERKGALACIPMDILRAVDAPGATGITDDTPLVAAVRRMTEMGRRLLAERDAAREALRGLYDYARCWPAEDGRRFHCLLEQASAALARGGEGG